MIILQKLDLELLLPTRGNEKEHAETEPSENQCTNEIETRFPPPGRARGYFPISQNCGNDPHRARRNCKQHDPDEGSLAGFHLFTL